MRLSPWYDGSTKTRFDVDVAPRFVLLRPPRAVADEERYFLAQSALFEAGGGFERYADAAAALVAARGSGEAGGGDLNNDHLLLGLGFGDTLADSASIVMPGQPGQSPQGGAHRAHLLLPAAPG